MMRGAVSAVSIVVAVVLVSSSVWAIPPAIPRQYQPMPVDTNVFLLAYNHITANTGPDQSMQLVKSADITVNGAMAVYLHYFDVGGNTSYVWASLPGADASANVNSTYFGSIARSVSGVGQPVFGFNYGYKGAPAMAPGQFACWQQTTTLNAALYVSPPIGSYDRDRLLNISTNRWEFKPEFTFAHRFGRLLAEVYGNAQLFADNTEFLGSRTLSQGPLYGLDAHFSYDLRPTAWVSFDLYQRWGGHVSVNGRSALRSQNFTTLGFTLSGNVTPTDVVYIMYDQTISSDMNPDFQSVQFLYGHLW